MVRLTTIILRLEYKPVHTVLAYPLFFPPLFFYQKVQHCIVTQTSLLTLHEHNKNIEMAFQISSQSTNSRANKSITQQPIHNIYHSLQLAIYRNHPHFNFHTKGKYLDTPRTRRNGVPSSHIHGGSHHEFNERTPP